MAGIIEDFITEAMKSEGLTVGVPSLYKVKDFSPKKLSGKERYLQIAFNGDIDSARQIIPQLPKSERIFIEAGTPFIKKYGEEGIKEIASLWGGLIVADIKTVDGAADEVAMCQQAGAHAATVIGGAPTETIDSFISSCQKLNVYSMIDMIGVKDPLAVIRKLKTPPNVVILHKGRDEESTRGKVIEYRHVNRIKSKYDVLISAAGGVDLGGSRSAIFNGASIVVVNMVTKNDSWNGINETDDVAGLANEFLETIK